MTGPRDFLRRFGKARDGVSAVEFALIAPVLILMFFGMTELSQAFMAQRRVQHVASTIADLTAQTGSVNDAALTDIFAIGNVILSPFSTTPLTQRITSVTANAQGVAKVDWSVGKNTTARTVASTVTVPANLIAANESVIMAEVTYAYTGFTAYVMNRPLTFSQTYYLRPRLTTKVTKT